MIASSELAALRIRKVIFHDIPRNPKGGDFKPRLSAVPTPLQPRQRDHLHTRITRALASKSAYDIEFNPDSGSPVPGLVRAETLGDGRHFVKNSQAIANYLHEQQTGSNPPGLLTVIEAIVQGRRSLVVLKLEREEGAQLEFDEGSRTFSMDVLENLVLTDGTRLFKSALFVRDGPGDHELRGVACDNQRSFASTLELAQFWMRFLGCRVTEEPQITTKRFFDTALEYISTEVDDPVAKSTLYDHVVSEMMSQKKYFSPQRFIEDYVQSEHRTPFHQYLIHHQIKMQRFEIDVREIEGRLKRRAYDTQNGVKIVVPEEHADLVEVGAEEITVHDTVTRVGR